MEFANHNDLDLILKLEHHGKPIRVSDCVRFAVRVYTQSRNNFLLFTERDVIKGEHRDRLVIAGYQMATLESGVVVYEYSYSLTDRHFKPFEGHPHDHTKRVVTDQYWKNCNYNQIPSNPVNFQSLNYLRELIEKEVADRENAIIDLKDYFDSGFIAKLDEEIKRSNEVDVELFNRIKEEATNAAEATKAVSAKLDEEIKRSNEVDIELFNAIKKAGDTSASDKEETDNKITETNTALADEVERAKAAEKDLNDAIVAEADRAKAAERQLTNDLTDEVSRAKVKENELDAKIDGEIARAKVIENALTDSVDAVRDKANQIANDLAAEVSRSNQKDNEHTSQLNDETTRAKAAEKAIVDRLDVIEGNAETIGSIAHCLEDAKHYADDKLAKVNAVNATAVSELTDALNSEVSRAQTKEAELEAVLAVVNGSEETIGSISNAEANAKKYADEQIAKTLSDHNTDLTDLTNKVNTEVSRAETAEKALSDRLDIVETGVSNAADAIVNLTTADNDLSNALASEVSRATTKESEIDAALAVVNGDKTVIGSIAHALEDSKHYTDNQIANLKTETNTNLADALKPYATKAEVDGRIEGIIGTAPAALDTLGEIADRLSEDSDAITAINGVLSGKANANDVYTKAEADAKHTAITNDLSSLNTALSNEIDRAQNAETLISNKVDAVDTKVDAVKAVADQSASDIADEVNRAKAAETALSNDLSALDTKVDGVKTKAEKNESDIAELSTELTGAKSDINGLNDAIASEVSRAETAEGVITAKVDALDTKVEGVKAVSDKAAADIIDEVSRAKTAETALSNDINALTSDLASEVSRATVKEGELENGVGANATKIADLTTRTSAVEGEINTLGNDVHNLKDAIAVVNGDENTIGSISHAESDAKHYCDDEIAKLTAKVEAEVVGFATKSEVAAVDAKVDNLKSKVDNIEAPDAYTKAEVDQMIEDIDVTDQLVDYAKKSETTVIKDENGVVITEMIIDNSEADDTIEVYTKQQVDEMFASVPQIVTLTQSEYDALANKAPNTLYLVNG